MKNKTKTLDMTKGSIGKSLFLFSIPLFISSIIQQMYNTVDLIFVGNYLGTNSAAAVGAGSMLITCLIGLFSGLAVGTNVVLAKIFGCGDKERFLRGFHTALLTAIIGGIILTIIGIIGAPYFLKLMKTPLPIMNEAVSYIRIYFLSITSMLVYNTCSGIIRAGGNSNIPMIAQFTGGIINIFANTLLIYILDMGIKGTALATLFSQTTAALYVLLHLCTGDKEFEFNFKNLKIHKDILKEIIIIGIPAGIQSLVISLSNVVVQSYINCLDIDSIAAFICYIKVELLLYYPIMAIGQAIMTFTGQNIGAGNIDRMKRGIRISIIYGIFMIIVVGNLLLKNGEFWFGLFDSDLNVISKGIEIISVTFPFYFVYVVMEVLSSAIRGSGKSIPPMIIILSNICALRIFILYIISPHIEGVKGIAVVYPITWITTSLFMAGYYLIHIGNLKRNFK
ncbi:MATE family efflux transporter [uncultured Clostridium sp.]|uniref:MATE family efflux transporter n=1 Tax=uncultured Clostridium sp. TaxID=59620 RepID=UPI0025DBE193|nr:MATE family efflux transporter [uncultured Clostridium sp.]